MAEASKTAKQLERHFKGVANHWRIAILRLIAESEGISVEDIADKLNGNIKTISVHVQKLTRAGLVNKSHKGKIVQHSLSPYGKKFLRFINSF